MPPFQITFLTFLMFGLVSCVTTTPSGTPEHSEKPAPAPEPVMALDAHFIPPVYNHSLCLPFTPDPAQLHGSSIIAADSEFLGYVTQEKFGKMSIGWALSNYGSTLSKTSIYNRFSPYGSITSDLSAYNKRANYPPRLVMSNGRWLFLTVNKRIRPRIDPDVVTKWARRKR